jgi:hypothetical protein
MSCTLRVVLFAQLGSQGQTIPLRWMCFALVLALSRSAAADPKFQVTGDGSLGYTDNVQSAPTEPVAGVAPRAGGAFAVLRPGAVLALNTPQLLHRLSYEFTYNLFFGASGANTTSNRLEYRGFYDLSPRTTLVVGSSAVESNPDMATTLGGTAILPGATAFVAGTGDALLTYDLAPQWRTWQGVSVLAQAPLFETTAPRTAELGARTGLERAFSEDALGIEARASYTVIAGGFLFDGSPAGTQRQIVAAGVASWRRDWGRQWSSAIEAGGMRVERLSTGRGFFYPTGSAALAYANDFGDAELSYAHRTTTNTLLGQFLLVDEVRLRAGLPISASPALSFVTSSSYQRGRLIDDQADLAAHLAALLLDAGLGWQAIDTVLLSVKYQYVQQWSDADRPPLPLSFVRNAVTLGATVKFPPDAQMPRPYRAPRRIDRSDEVRDGDVPPAPRDAAPTPR